MELHGKTYLITGASTGIGKALAEKLAAYKDVTIILLARREELLKELAENIRNENNTIYYYACDVADRENVKEVFENAYKDTGFIDIAILNAGVGGKMYMNDFSAERASNIIRVNIEGIMNCTEALMPSMLEKKEGVIVGVSSLADKRGFGGSGVYCASKAGASVLLESFRVDLNKYNIRVVTVKPGFVETPMTEKNEFSMPMLMSAEKAAGIILRGIRKEKKIISFPLPITLGSKALRLIPNFLFDKMAAKY